MYTRNKISHSNSITIIRIDMWIGNCSKRSWMGEPTHIKMEVAMAPTNINMAWNIFSFIWTPYELIIEVVNCYVFLRTTYFLSLLNS